jgi:hypothetical protein
MLLPAAADGGPHQPIRPGDTWTPSWRIDQPAATLWYHPHLHPSTAAHVNRGLAGLFLLDDPHTDRLALPDRYGSTTSHCSSRTAPSGPTTPSTPATWASAAPPSPGCWGGIAGQRHPQPASAGHRDPDSLAGPQRLQRPRLQPGVQRRPAVVADRQRKRPAARPPAAAAGAAIPPANAPNWWPSSPPVNGWCYAASRPPWAPTPSMSAWPVATTTSTSSRSTPPPG